jgi:site-specific DNA-methyltransferase (adenine-specific)
MNEYINRINCADWRNFMPIIGDNTIDLVVSDPPYGMNFQSSHREVKYDKIANDDNLDWLPDWVAELKRVAKENAHLYIFCSWHKIDVFKQEFERHFRVKNVLIWVKNNTGMGDLYGDYAPQYEMILFCSNGEKKLKGRRDSSVLSAKITGNVNHPTEKPVKLLSFLVEKSSNEGDLVLDTFAGSFSTAQACKQTKRNFVSCEINPDYCERAKLLLSGVTETLF